MGSQSPEQIYSCIPQLPCPVREQEAGLWRVRSCCHGGGGTQELMQWGCLGKVLSREQGPTCRQAPVLAEMWHGDYQAPCSRERHGPRIGDKCT